MGSALPMPSSQVRSFDGLLLVFGPQFLSLFATEPAVIDAGMERIRIMGFSYAFSCFMDCSIAASRGIGKSIPPTIIIILGSQCIPCHLVLYGVCTLPDHFPHFISCIFSHGELQALRRFCSFAVSFRKNSDLILQIYSARRSIDLALFISSRVLCTFVFTRRT